MTAQPVLFEPSPLTAGADAAPATRLPGGMLAELFRSMDSAFKANRSLSIIAVSTSFLALVAGGFALHVARPIALPLACAFILSLLLAPIADWLGRRGMPEGGRAALVVLAASAIVLAGFFYAGKPMVAWIDRMPEIVTEARDRLSGVEAAVEQAREVSRTVEEIAEGEGAEEPREVVVRETSMSAVVAQSLRAVVTQMLLTAILAYFLLATRTSFRRKAMALRPTRAGKLKTARLLRNMQRNVGSYMLTMVAINLGLGAATAAAMAMIGLPQPIVWGAFAAILNFIPYAGPLVLTALLGVAGLVHFEALPMAAAPAAIYMAFNFIESNLVTPSLIGVRLKISPLAIIVAVVFLAWMWGPVGAVIAIPLVVALKTACDAIEPLRPLGVLMGEVSVVRGRKVGFCRIDTVHDGARRGST